MSSLKLTEQQLREFLFQTFSKEFENKNVQENKKNIKIKNTNRHHTLLKESPKDPPPTPTLPPNRIVQGQSGPVTLNPFKSDEITPIESQLQHNFTKTLNNTKGISALSDNFETVKELARKSNIIKKSNLSKEKVGAMALAQITMQHSQGLGWNPDSSFFDFWLKETFTRDELGLKTNEELLAQNLLLRNIQNGGGDVNIVTQFRDLQPIMDLSSVLMEPGYIAYQKFGKKIPLAQIKPMNMWFTVVDAALAISQAINRASRTGKLEEYNSANARDLVVGKIKKSPTLQNTAKSSSSEQQKTEEDSNNQYEDIVLTQEQVEGSLTDIIWWEKKFFWLDLLGAIPLVGSICSMLLLGARKSSAFTSGTRGTTAIANPTLIRYTTAGEGTIVKTYADLETNFFKSGSYDAAMSLAQKNNYKFVTDASDNITSELDMTDTNVTALLDSNPYIKKLITAGFKPGYAVLLFYSNPAIFKSLDSINLDLTKIYKLFQNLLFNEDIDQIDQIYDSKIPNTNNLQFPGLKEIRDKKIKKFNTSPDEYNSLNNEQKKDLFFQSMLEYEANLAKSTDAATVPAEHSLLRRGVINNIKESYQTNASHFNEVLKNATDEAFISVAKANIKSNALLNLTTASFNDEIIEIIGKLGDDEFLDVFNKYLPDFKTEDLSKINNVQDYLQYLDDYDRKLKKFEELLKTLGMSNKQNNDIITTLKSDITSVKNELNQITSAASTIPKLKIDSNMSKDEILALENEFRQLNITQNISIYNRQGDVKTNFFFNTTKQLETTIEILFDKIKNANEKVDYQLAINSLNNIWYTVKDRNTFLTNQKLQTSNIDKIKTLQQNMSEENSSFTRLNELKNQIGQKLNAQRPKQNEFFADNLQASLPKNINQNSNIIDGPQEKYYDLNDTAQKVRYEIDRALWTNMNQKGKFPDEDKKKSFIDTYITIKYKSQIDSINQRIATAQQNLNKNKQEIIAILEGDLNEIKSKNDSNLNTLITNIESRLNELRKNSDNVLEQINEAVKDIKAKKIQLTSQENINKIKEQVESAKKANDNLATFQFQKKNFIDETVKNDVELNEIIEVVERSRGREYVFRRVNYNFVNRLNDIKVKISEVANKEKKDVSQECFKYYQDNATKVHEFHTEEKKAGIIDKTTAAVKKKLKKVADKNNQQGVNSVDESKSAPTSVRNTVETEKFLMHIMNGYIDIDELQVLNLLKLMKANMSLNVNTILLILNPDTVTKKQFIDKMLTGDATLDLVDDESIYKLLAAVEAKGGNIPLKNTKDLGLDIDELVNKIPELIVTINQKMKFNEDNATNYLDQWRLTEGVWKSGTESLKKSITALQGIQKQVAEDIKLIDNEMKSRQHVMDPKRQATLETTKKCFEEILKNTNECFIELANSSAGQAGLDLFGNLKKIEKSKQSDTFQDELLNRQSVLTNFLSENSNPQIMRAQKTLNWLQRAQNFYARCTSAFKVNLLGQNLSLIKSVAGGDEFTKKLDELPEMQEVVKSEAGIESFIQILTDFRQYLTAVNEKDNAIIKVLKKTLNGIINWFLLPLQYFLKYPTATFIAFKTISYVSLFTGVSSVFLTQTMILFGLKLMTTCLTGVGFKFLLWCLTGNNKTIITAARSFLTDITGFISKLIKITTRLSIIHARVRTEADELEDLDSLETSWSPEGWATWLFFKTAKATVPGVKGSTIKEFYAKDVASFEQAQETNPDDTRYQQINDSLRILETEYARKFQNNFDRFIMLLSINLTDNISKNDQSNKMLRINDFDEKFSIKYLSSQGLSKLQNCFAEFKNKLKIENKDKAMSDSLPILFYFYLTQKLKDTENNISANRNKFIAANFDEVVSAKDFGVDSPNAEFINLQTHASLCFSEKNQKIKNSDINNIITNIKDFFKSIGFITTSGKVDLNTDVSIYDCQIIIKFLNDIQVEKSNLIKKRKKTNFNKEGHLNLEAMLTGGLYKVEFGKLIEKNEEKIVIQNASINEDYKPKEYTYTENDQEKKTTLTYLRQFSESAPNTVASQLSEDLWVTNWQPKKNSFISGMIPDLSTLVDIKNGLLFSFNLTNRLLTVGLDPDVEWDVKYLISGEPPRNFVDRYKALTYLEKHRKDDNLQDKIESDAKNNFISQEIKTIINELLDEEAQDESKISSHSQELIRLKEVNKDNLIDKSWNIDSEAFDDDDGKDYKFENYKLNIKNGKKLIVEDRVNFDYVAPFETQEYVELARLKALSAPYRKIKNNQLKYNLTRFNTVRKGTFITDDSSNKENIKVDLERSNTHMNEKDLKQNVQKLFADYKQKLQQNTGDTDKKRLLAELDQFRNYTVEQIMENPSLIDQMAANAQTQIERIEKDVFNTGFDVTKIQKLNDILKIYNEDIAPRLEKTKAFVADYKKNLEKLEEAVKDSKGTNVNTLIDSINILSINISKQGICLGKPRNNLKLKQIIENEKFRNSNLDLHEKVSLFQDDITKLYLCMQEKDNLKINLNNVTDNIDELSNKLKNSQSNLLFSVITDAIKKINENSINILNDMSTTQVLCNLKPACSVNINNQEHVIVMDPINKLQTQILNNFAEKDVTAIVKDYSAHDFTAIDYEFLPDNLPKGIRNGKSVKDIYTSIFIDIEAIAAEVDTNENPIVGSSDVEVITKNYVEMILKPVFGDDIYGKDFVLDEKKSDKDSIIGFYYDKQAMISALTNEQSNLNINDFEKLQNLINHENSFFINRIIYASKEGMQQISEQQGNEYLQKLEYIYEVDISKFYFYPFTKQKIATNQKTITYNNKKITPQKLYEYYGFPYLNKDAFSINQFNNVFEIMDPTDGKNKTFDASHIVFKYRETYPLSVYSYKGIRVKYLKTIVDGSSREPLKMTSLKDFEKIFFKR